MNNKIVLIIVSLFLFLNISNGQNILGGGIGLSMPTGDGSEYWKAGFIINGEYFKKFSDNIFIGGRAAWNRWTPDEDELLADVGNLGGVSVDISGSASVIELIPSARYYLTTNQGEQLQFFGQAGLGLFIISLDAKVKASYMGQSFDMGIDDSDSNLGINLGGGAIFDLGNMKLSICPLYNIIFTSGESTSYFTVNLGIVLDN